MFDACSTDDVNEAKKLIKAGFSTTQIIDEKKKHTPLHVASRFGSNKVAPLLIQSGAPIDAPTPNNKVTPLHTSCAYGNVQTVSLLIKAGASVNARSEHNHCATPLAVAFINAIRYPQRDTLIIRKLLENGADLEAVKDANGLSLMQSACKFGHPELVVEILRHVSKTGTRDEFQSLLENARSWFVRRWIGPGPSTGLPLSSLLTKEVMDSFENNLCNNMENTDKEKGGR